MHLKQSFLYFITNLELELGIMNHTYNFEFNKQIKLENDFFFLFL